jgi:hypothetical protein
LDIRNRGGRLTLELEFWRKPDGPRTVWASLPCNLGQKKPTSCPRLGWIPATQGRWCNITRLYLDKHGAQIKERGLQLVGKRIFVRLRLEVDEGVALFEQAKAKVPKPEVEIDRKGPISSNKLRTSFERASNELRNITGTSRVHRASNARAGGRRGRKSRPGPLHPGSGPKRAGAG